MSKRPYSDVPADDREPEAAEVSVRKKSKKVKDIPAEADVETQVKPSKKEKKEKKEKEGKKEKKDKKEKKKKSEQEIAESATTTEETIEAVAPVAEHEDTSDKAARKAARKAEKSRLKALKEAGKKDKKPELGATDPVDVSSERSTPKEGLSTGVSTVASTGASSLTSPEPLIVGVSPSSSSYTEDSRLTALPQAQIDSFLEKNYITITDPLSNAPKFRPITDFSQLPITDKSQLAPFASFTAPTPIQSASWPSLFAGRDMIGVAETGSGKTLAFGVPCIKAIGTKYGNQKGTRVRAVVVSPTRELAMQIYEQLETLAVPAGLQAVCIYGGVPKDPQKIAVKKSSIVVATPGRLNDLVDEGSVDLSNVEYLVLDEADRMLDKGFEDAIRKIIGQTPTDRRQTLMFTATWPPSVQALASTFMKSPVRINVGENQTGDLRANNRITQKVEVIDPYAKEQRLLQILKQYTAGKLKNDRILVFCLYKKEATRIENFIRTRGFNVAGIHGDLGQAQRTASLDAFKKGRVSILVATDVAARGLDIPEVKLVVNVTFPLTVEDYVHRIGRTGRAGKTGEAITLFTEHDKGLTGALVNVLNGANQPVPEELMKFGTTVKKKGHEAYGAFYRDTGDMKKATKITFD